MELRGTFGRFIKRNEKTGESLFTIHPSDSPVNTMICEGISISYPKRTPLYITGEPVKSEEGYLIFHAECIRAMAYNDEVATVFLSSNQFKAIGPVIAGNIVSKLDGELFSSIFNMTDEELAKFASSIYSKGIDLMSAFQQIRSDTILEHLIEKVVSYGGTYYNAMMVYYRFGAGSLEALSSNPYILLCSDMSLAACEKLAKEAGMEHCDQRRMRMIVENAMIKNSQNGNTLISFHDLCSKIHHMEENAGGIYTSNPLFIGEVLCDSKYHIVTGEDGDVYVYNHNEYESENMITENIARLTTSAIKLPWPGKPIAEIEKACGNLKYSVDQVKAFDLLKKSGVKIVTGGPGVGKTTTLNGIIAKYSADNPGAIISLCAPTARAARRMAECTGRDAFTVQKLLQIRPYEDIMQSFGKKLDADCVIVDECSMMDTFLMARLLSSVKNGGLVILVGDKDQLPSVSAGNVFEDLLESGVIEVYHLTSIFRQSSRSLIIENGRRVIQGDYRLKTDRTFQIKTFDTECDMVKEAEKIAKQCHAYGGVEFKLFTPSKNKKFATGTVNMNKLLQKVRYSEESDGVEYGFYRFSVGDTVIFTRNNYDTGYFNGQEGIIKNIQKHSQSYVFAVDVDGECINISGADIADMDLGYALTAHKSQGGECDNALILVPKEPASLLKRQLLYVEITRARKNVIMLCEKGALVRAVGSLGVIKRNTGLKQMLQTRSVQNVK